MANIGKGKFYMVNTATHKKCPICGELKERSEFYKWKSRQDGLTAYCKPCFNSKNKKWFKENPDKLPTLEEKRAYGRKKNFGISEEQYEQMLVDQNNQCAICKKEIGWEAAVDHCHTTDKIRGLLCRKCNLGLGGFKDNIKTIKKAISYVKNM
jgi:Recombination endonuclease VII